MTLSPEFKVVDQSPVFSSDGAGREENNKVEDRQDKKER